MVNEQCIMTSVEFCYTVSFTGIQQALMQFMKSLYSPTD